MGGFHTNRYLYRQSNPAILSIKSLQVDYVDRQQFAITVQHNYILDVPKKNPVLPGIIF